MTLLTVVSCSGKPALPGKNLIANTWREHPSTFKDHLAKVKQGWTKDQLLAHAGNPDEEKDNAL